MSASAGIYHTTKVKNTVSVLEYTREDRTLRTYVGSIERCHNLLNAGVLCGHPCSGEKQTKEGDGEHCGLFFGGVGETLCGTCGTRTRPIDLPLYP